MKHFISLKDIEATVIERILERALVVKRHPSAFSDALEGRRLYMLFQKTSTRTALSFGVGISDLGGFYFAQNWEGSNFAIGRIEDEVRYVGRNVDLIMARLKSNHDINLMAKYSTVPVINGCCNKHHPCQAMADMLTIKELFGHFQVKMIYIGVRNNVLNSLMTSLPRLGGELIAITPIINEPSIDHEADELAKHTNRFREIDSRGLSKGDLISLVGDADVVYTDTWVDMEFFNDPTFAKERDRRINTMMPFQVNADLLANSKAIVMHDMPIHVGYEITRDTVEKHIDTILLQAENRRHSQNAVMLTLLEDDNIAGLFEARAEPD